MSNYLDNLLARSINPETVVQPRPISLYEPVVQPIWSPPDLFVNPNELMAESAFDDTDIRPRGISRSVRRSPPTAPLAQEPDTAQDDVEVMSVGSGPRVGPLLLHKAEVPESQGLANKRPGSPHNQVEPAAEIPLLHQTANQMVRPKPQPLIKVEPYQQREDQLLPEMSAMQVVASHMSPEITEKGVMRVHESGGENRPIEPITQSVTPSSTSTVGNSDQSRPLETRIEPTSNIIAQAMVPQSVPARPPTAVTEVLVEETPLLVTLQNDNKSGQTLRPNVTPTMVPSTVASTLKVAQSPASSPTTNMTDSSAPLDSQLKPENQPDDQTSMRQSNTTIKQYNIETQVRPYLRTMPPPSQTPSPNPEPTIQVTIGRIEVRAAPPASLPKAKTSTSKSSMLSLEDYLRQRRGGER